MFAVVPLQLLKCLMQPGLQPNLRLFYVAVRLRTYMRAYARPEMYDVMSAEYTHYYQLSVASQLKGSHLLPMGSYF